NENIFNFCDQVPTVKSKSPATDSTPPPLSRNSTSSSIPSSRESEGESEGESEDEGLILQDNEGKGNDDPDPDEME
mgnify:CR=1